MFIFEKSKVIFLKLLSNFKNYGTYRQNQLDEILHLREVIPEKSVNVDKKAPLNNKETAVKI